MAICNVACPNYHPLGRLVQTCSFHINNMLKDNYKVIFIPSIIDLAKGRPP